MSNETTTDQIRDLKQEVEEKDFYIYDLKMELEDKDEEIKELKQTVKNKEGHIEQLLEKERAFERQKMSRTYRLAMVFQKISAFFFPPYSRRRFLLRVMVRCVRHPKFLLKALNPKRIVRFFKMAKTDGMEGVNARYNEALTYYNQQEGVYDTVGLEIMPVRSSGKSRNKEDYKRFGITKTEHPLVSIVIPVYNQFDYTYKCIRAIKKHSGEVPYEIIIADDCSSDATKEMEQIISGIRVIHNEKNLRFLLNCNNAAKYARGVYILFLNNDTQVQQGWLQPLVDLMADPRVGMTGSKLVYANGALQEAGGILWKDGSAWNYGNKGNREDPEYNYVKEADYISGAAIMIRKSLWEEIGGFDERFVPAYCEDSDLAFEVRKHGYKVLYQPLSVVVHFEGVSNGTDLTQGVKKYQVDNQKKFLDKWKDVLEKEHFDNAHDVFLARDKSRDRKHILFIDHYVPTYDKDAGSKTTMMYLRMLTEKGYHITFLGDNFFRDEPYTTELQQMGIMVLYGPYYVKHWREWMQENAKYFDIFYLNRPHITIKYIDFIRKLPISAKIIYYGHDLHYLRTMREYELTGDEEKKKESEDWRKKELYIMRHTDMNYYPSVLEEQAIHEIDPQIPVKAITAYVYEQFAEIDYQAEQREGLLFVGGFGHQPNIDAVLWFTKEIFPKVYEKLHIPFYIVGAKAPEEITGIKQDGVIVKGFVSEEELKNLYAKCRMVVVPLRYGAGVKGKVVEAMYYGMPIVTTGVGAEGIPGVENAVIVKDGEEEMAAAICEAYNDPERLRRLSRNSIACVKEHFSTDAVWKVVKDDFMYDGK